MDNNLHNTHSEPHKVDQTNTPHSENEVSIMEYIGIIISFRWLILGVFIVTLTITAIYTLRLPRIYRATSVILLEDKNPAQQLMMFNQGLTRSSIRNMIQVMRSRPVLTLAYQIMQRYPDHYLFPIMAGSDEDTFDPVRRMNLNLQLSTTRDTDVITISYESTDPTEAMIIVNALADATMQQNTLSARSEFTNVREFLENQLDSVTRRLQASEEDLRSYKIESGVYQLAEETRWLMEKSADAAANYQSAQAQYSIAKMNLDFLQNELTVQDTLLSNVSLSISTPYIERLKQEVVGLLSRIATLQTNNDYPLDHPEIQRLNRNLDSAQEKLSEEIQKTLAIRAGSIDVYGFRNELIQKIANAQAEENLARARMISYQQIVENYDEKISILPDTQMDYARLQRNYAIDEKIFSMLSEKLEDAKVAEQSRLGNVRIIERSVMPQNPVKPNRKLNMLIGAVVGLGLGITLAMVLQSADTKVRTLDDVEKYVKYPIIGTIPFMDIKDTEEGREVDENSGEEVVTYEGDDETARQISARLISHYAPKSPIAEAFRTLRTNIMARKQAGSMAMIISSSGPGEGKSTSLANLAITLAQMNSSVVMVDFDLRRPVVHNIFLLERNCGSSDFLSDYDTPIESVIKHTNIKNLDVITSGAIPPNPSELIASERTTDMIQQLKAKYDYVLFDMPPIIAVTDAMIMAKKVDMMALVIRVNNTERSVVQRTKSMLEGINIKVTGVIVNGIVHEKYYRGYNYYYYYYYYYYYGEGKNNKKKKGFWNRLIRKIKPGSRHSRRAY